MDGRVCRALVDCQGARNFSSTNATWCAMAVQNETNAVAKQTYNCGGREGTGRLRVGGGEDPAAECASDVEGVGGAIPDSGPLLGLRADGPDVPLDRHRSHRAALERSRGQPGTRGGDRAAGSKASEPQGSKAPPTGGKDAGKACEPATLPASLKTEATASAPTLLDQ